MENNEKIDLAYSWINDLRERERLTYKELALILGMTDRGVANALKNRTLSLSKIEKIAAHFDKESELKRSLGSKANLEESEPLEEELPDGLIAIREIPEYIVKNEKTLVKNQIFRLWLKTKVQDGVIKILGK
jgi:transcriptional regulator with XRE-family HTH domain